MKSARNRDSIASGPALAASAGKLFITPPVEIMLPLERTHDHAEADHTLDTLDNTS